MATVSSTPRREGLVGRLNGRHHRAALTAYLMVVIGHWAEHLVQAYQIWVLGMPRPQSRGVLGQWFPWLVSSEWLHYGYALVMLVGLFLLRPGFTGRSRTWWTAALALQFWHHIEHLLLFVQAQTGTYLFGQAVPTSVIQLLVGRVELHLFYNSVVFIPMVIAMYRHLRPSDPELHAASCSCLAAQKRTLGLPAAPAPA